MQRLALVSCSLALVSACGGGDENPRESALATTNAAATITSPMVFDYAQRAFASLFPAAAGPDFTIFFEGKNFEARGFVGGNFLSLIHISEPTRPY